MEFLCFTIFYCRLKMLQIKDFCMYLQHINYKLWLILKHMLIKFQNNTCFLKKNIILNSAVEVYNSNSIKSLFLGEFSKSLHIESINCDTHLKS